MKSMKRPSVVQLAVETVDWPEKAKEILYKGHTVHVCRERDCVVPRMSELPLQVLNADEPIPCYPYSEVVVHLERLNGASYEIPMDFSAERSLLQSVMEMNRFLAQSNPERLLIRKGSHKWTKRILFYPEWGIKSSIRFWIRKMSRRGIQWLEMPGKVTQHGYAVVTAGLLPRE